MSSGCSAGDFFTAISLIVEIRQALRDSCGSAHEYQQVASELNALRNTLEQVTDLEPVQDLEPAANVTKVASTCHVPLREFLANVKHYEASLSEDQSRGVRWRMLFTRLDGERRRRLN